MHTFLANLTDLHYKVQGLTVLYIPQEGLNLSVEEASKDMEFVKRLEGNMHPDMLTALVI
jgi:dynein heavy chain